MDAIVTDPLKAIIETIARNEGFETFNLSASKGSSVGDNYLSNIVRIVVSGKKTGNVMCTKSFIAKLALMNPELRKNSFIQQFFKREYAAYTMIFPSLEVCQRNLPRDYKFQYPKYFGSVLENEEILVMEDLSVRGYKMSDRMQSFDYDQLTFCIKSLAKFHSTSIVLKAKQPEIYNRISKISVNFEEISDALTQFICNCIPSIQKLIENEPYNENFQPIMKNIMSDLKWFFDPSNAAPYDVLCHCDCWSNNMLFQYEDTKVKDLILVDWQLIRSTSPLIDISYILLCGIDSNIRHRHYEEMLDLYYETLALNVSKMGVDISHFYPRSIYEDQIKVFMKYGLFMSFGLLPLVLSNKEDTRDISEVIKKGNVDFSLSKTCSVRLKEVFADCIKYGII